MSRKEYTVINPAIDYSRREEIIEDYYPLTIEEIEELLLAAKKEDETGRNSIHRRLTQGIPLITYIHPIEGEIADKIAKLDELYRAYAGSIEMLGDVIDQHRLAVKLHNILNGNDNDARANS